MFRALIAFILILASFTTGIAATSAASRNEAALDLIAFPWQQLHYEIVFMAPQRGFRAMTIVRDHRIEIYARPGDDPRQIASDIAHELGHAVDLTLNTEETRRKWMELRGIDPSTPWFGCNRCSDYNTPAGDFAETFALLLVGPGHFSGRIAPAPTEQEISHLKAFFPGLADSAE